MRLPPLTIALLFVFIFVASFFRALSFINYSHFLNISPSVTLPLVTEPKTFGYYQYLDFGYLKIKYFGKDSFRAGDILFVKKGAKPEITKVGQTRIAFIVRRFSSMRNYINNIYLTNFGSPYGELLSGMVLGIKNLPADFEQKLIEVGLIHIVVVSGFNVSLIISALFPQLLAFGRTKALIVTLLGVFCFVLLVGFEPPIIRAGLMGLVVCVSKFYGREYNSVLILLGVAFLMLFFNPLLVNSVSFLLSFSATFGIIVLPSHSALRLGGAPLSRIGIIDSSLPARGGMLRVIAKVLRESFISTLSAQIAVWPIICYYFGRVSVVSILVNVLVVWSVPFITISGFAYIALNLVSRILPISFLLKFFSFIMYIPLLYLEKIVTVFSSLSIASMDFKLSLPSVVLYYVLLLGVLLVGRKGKNDKSKN